MFEQFSSPIQSKKKKKVVILLRNGKPAKSIKYQYSKNLSKNQILQAIEKEWEMSFSKCIRIFSVEGIEYLDEDLLFLKNQERLYISRGEEFDSNNNFGEFQIIKKLGQGGFGCVELARNKITGEYAAIKVLKTNKNSNSSDIDMLFKQAEYLKSLNHPHIVKILNCYALKDMKVIIVMEYLEGGELLGLLKQKKNLTEEQAKFYFKQIISAVSYCHRQGIIHKDLKLQNLLLKNQKILKVADFGISGVADRFNPDADWGTIRYMAPEILSGKMKVNSPAVDVWACGIILYQLIIGNVPFDGLSSSQITQAITKKNLTFPDNIQISQKCQRLIQKMLCKNPQIRIKVSQIETDPWMLFNQERPQSSIKKAVPTQLSEKLLVDIKKQQRKSINLPRAHLNVKIPKRLQKERDQLQQQLRGYYKGQNRRNIHSETKLFPQLNHRKKKYTEQQSKLTVHEQKKDIFKSWK